MSNFTAQQLDDWRAYEMVRKGGRYNMICDPRAREATGLERDEYLFVLENFSELKEAAARTAAQAKGER